MVHADADFEVIAGMTPGFSGADLASIIHEATLLAVRRNKEQVRPLGFAVSFLLLESNIGHED